MKNIVLIGMPGAGKTTIGGILANNLSMKFCDIDKYIEEKTGKTISEIFQDGEDAFRYIEREVVKELSGEAKMVIATGGGVIKDHKNMEKLRENGLIFFINRPLENIMGDIDIETRPLLKDDKERLYDLFDERYPLYKKYCHYEIINIGSLQEVSKRIIDIIKENLA